jgi:hypothetical protein
MVGSASTYHRIGEKHEITRINTKKKAREPWNMVFFGEPERNDNVIG